MEKVKRFDASLIERSPIHLVYDQVLLKTVVVDKFNFQIMKNLILISFLLSLACQNKEKPMVQSIGNSEKSDLISENITPSENMNNFTTDTLQLIIGQIDYASSESFVFVNDQQVVSKGMYLDKEVFEQFKKMQVAAKKEGVHLKIISGVRNFADQKRIWERKWLDRNHIIDEKERALDILKYSSMPMTSRHHWGTDIDMNSLDNKYFSQGQGLKVYKWLSENANQYGFHQVYTNKKTSNRTGYEEEKWHWSYLPKAKKYLDFYNKNLTNTEIKGFLGSSQAQAVDMLKNYVNGVSTD